MNRADVWLGNAAPNAQPGNVEARLMDTARLIAQRPSVVVLNRKLPGVKGDTQLAPQTFRVEIVQAPRGSSDAQNALMAISQQYVVLIGLKGHSTLPDADIQRGDWFMLNNRRCTVSELVDTVPGRLLASCQFTP